MFITIEGNEGAGKSSLLNKLNNYFLKNNYDILITREPGGHNCEIAEKIRSLIFENDTNIISEFLLYMLSRSEHIEKIIAPALKNKKLVICDRFFDSSAVYQGYISEKKYCNNLTLKKVLNINKEIFNKFIPNLTLLILVEPEHGINRIIQNNRDQNKFDKKNSQYHRNIYYGYLELAKIEQKRIHVIDGNKLLNEVFSEAIQIIKKHLLKNEYSKNICK